MGLIKRAIGRAKVRRRQNRDLKELDQRQENVFQKGDQALYVRHRNTAKLQEAIQAIKLYNRSLLAKARQLRKQGKVEEEKRVHEAIQHGIRTIQNFYHEIEILEN